MQWDSESYPINDSITADQTMEGISFHLLYTHLLLLSETLYPTPSASISHPFSSPHMSAQPIFSLFSLTISCHAMPHHTIPYHHPHHIPQMKPNLSFHHNIPLPTPTLLTYILIFLPSQSPFLLTSTNQSAIIPSLN